MRPGEPHRSGGGEGVLPFIHHVDLHKAITYLITHRHRPRTRFYRTTSMTFLTDGARNSFPPAMASSYGALFCPGNWSGPGARRCRCTDALRQREWWRGPPGIAQLGAQDHQGYLPLARPDQFHDRHEAPVGPVGDLGSLEQQTASLSLVGRVRKEHPIARHRLPVLSA